MPTFTVRMAKATPADLAAAYAVAGILDSIERGFHPIEPDDGREPFDPEDPDHLRALYAELRRVTKNASLYRVAGGLETLLSEHNAIVDPAADVLELHPRFKAIASTASLAEALRAILTAHAGSAAEVKAMADGLTALDAYDNPPEEPAHA